MSRVPVVVDESVLGLRDGRLGGVRGSGVSLWDACRDDLVVFAELMLGIRLYGWQFLVAEAVNRGDRRVIVNSSRQIGKSTFAAILALWFAVFNKGASSKFVNTKVGVVSATDDQAKKLMLDIKNFIFVGDAVCRERYSKRSDDVFGVGLFSYLVDGGRGAENNRSSITFKRYDKVRGVVPELLKGSKIGCFIKSLPPTDVVRGNTFDLLIVDEASLIDDEIYNMAISKTGDKYDAVRLITSTPRGHSGFFYEYFDPEEKFDDGRWTRFWFTIDSIRLDAPEEYELRMADIRAELGRGKFLVVRQEYYGEFVQSEQSFFNPLKVDDMVDSDLVMLEGFRLPCDLGVDFGGLRTSRTVLTISFFDEKAGVVRRLFHKVYGVREDADLISDMEELMGRFNVQRVVVDDCPEGDYKIREMEDKGWLVTRMVFAREKIRKYGEFRSFLNKGLIKSYPDAELVGEMKALLQVDGKSRTMIRHASGVGDDLIDSFLLSVYHFVGGQDDFKFY